MKVQLIPTLTTQTSEPVALPFLLERISCGFPNPSAGLIDRPLDIAEYLIRHPAATYFCRADGDSLIGRCIADGALLIVDRSVKPETNSIVIACLYGEYTAKILHKEKRQLLSANPLFPPIDLPEDVDLLIEGVVIHAVNHFVNV